MGAAAGIVAGALGLLGAHKQARAAKDAAAAEARAVQEATKVKAYDLVKDTHSQTADSAQLGSTDRKDRRRRKNALTINRGDNTLSGGGGAGITSTGLNI